MTTSLDTYRAAIHLDDTFNVNDWVPSTKNEVARLIDRMLDGLLSEAGRIVSDIKKDKRQLLQRLLTTRPPHPLPDQFWADMDRLQVWETRQKTITDGTSIASISKTDPVSGYSAAENCALWQGDITTLNVDAIVNAANTELLGCFSPFHACIDNAIHTAAGPRLRQDCQIIMRLQGAREKTGKAKITRGYHLPAQYVLHTVGPIYAGPEALAVQSGQLADCYRSCLDLGAQIKGVKGIRTIAFCSISTGVFGFPPDLAARIALQTVADWMAIHPGRMKVIFNLFSDSDVVAYRSVLSGMK